MGYKYTKFHDSTISQSEKIHWGGGGGLNQAPHSNNKMPPGELQSDEFHPR